MTVVSASCNAAVPWVRCRATAESSQAQLGDDAPGAGGLCQVQGGESASGGSVDVAGGGLGERHPGGVDAAVTARPVRYPRDRLGVQGGGIGVVAERGLAAGLVHRNVQRAEPSRPRHRRVLIRAVRLLAGRIERGHAGRLVAGQGMPLGLVGSGDAGQARPVAVPGGGRCRAGQADRVYRVVHVSGELGFAGQDVGRPHRVEGHVGQFERPVEPVLRGAPVGCVLRAPGGELAVHRLEQQQLPAVGAVTALAQPLDQPDLVEQDGRDVGRPGAARGTRRCTRTCGPAPALRCRWRSSAGPGCR